MVGEGAFTELDVTPWGIADAPRFTEPRQITLNDLEKIGLPEVDLLVLRQHGYAGEQINAVKVIKTGELKRAVILKGLTATAGAKAAIEAAGGKLVDQA